MTGAEDGSDMLRIARTREADVDGTISALRNAHHEAEREWQHQIRNMLAVVRSIARRSVADGETAEDFQVRLDSRLASFANLQSQIVHDPHRGVDLYTLIDGELIAFGIKLGDQAHAEGPSVRLKSKPATILGLAFHELGRMSIEGGATASLDGCLDVQWSLITGDAQDERLSLVWTETGRRSSPNSGLEPALGREIVEQAVAYEVGGDVDLEITPDGMRCQFNLPVTCLI